MASRPWSRYVRLGGGSKKEKVFGSAQRNEVVRSAVEVALGPAAACIERSVYRGRRLRVGQKIQLQPYMYVCMGVWCPGSGSL